VTLIADRYQPLDAPRPGAPQRARDLQTAQTVLLREIRLPRDTPEEALRRARAAKGIFHPSLVTLFDVLAQADGRVLLAYEFVPAQSLAQVSGGHPFNAKRAAEILTEIAELDRVADPSLNIPDTPSTERDIAALGELLQELVGRPAAGGVPGMQAIETVIDRARAGKFQSAATFAAMLRRL